MLLKVVEFCIRGVAIRLLSKISILSVSAPAWMPKFEELDTTNMLLRQRIVFLGSQVDDMSADFIISQLLFLDAEDDKKDIKLFINSPACYCSNSRETKGNQTTSRNQTRQQKTPRGEQGQKCPNPQGHQQPNNTQGGAPHQRSRQEKNQTAQPKPDQKRVKTLPREKTTTKGKNVQKRPNPPAQ